MPFDLIIFALILAVLFFDAILSMVALAGPFNCLDGQQFLSGSTGAHPSVHSVLGWAGGLILFLLVSQSLAALILRQKFSPHRYFPLSTVCRKKRCVCHQGTGRG